MSVSSTKKRESQPNDCIFCDTPDAKGFSGPYDGSLFNCPICGRFRINGTQLVMLTHRENHLQEKLKIAQLLAERKLTNNSKFEIVAESYNGNDSLSYLSVEGLLKDYPNDFLERLDRTLINLSLRYPEGIIIDKYFQGDDESIKRQELQENQLALLLFAPPHQYKSTLDHLLDEEWLRNESTDRSKNYTITVKGWKHLRELKKRPAGNTNQAFVAMWFDKSRNTFYDNGIKKACQETGYKALRIDYEEHNEKICDKIIAEIRKSRILIADFTGNRGGVYFEAGFALGLGIPVIYLFDEKDFDNNGPHFDTRQYNHIVYENENDLFEKLKNRILATTPIEL